MQLSDILKLVEAGFTAEEIRAWTQTTRPQAQAPKKRGRPPLNVTPVKTNNPAVVCVPNQSGDQNE
jgi:hypothetical protein